MPKPHKPPLPTIRKTHYTYQTIGRMVAHHWGRSGTDADEVVTGSTDAQVHTALLSAILRSLEFIEGALRDDVAIRLQEKKAHDAHAVSKGIRESLYIRPDPTQILTFRDCHRLSHRARVSLRRAKIRTRADITVARLAGIRGCGPKTIAELLQFAKGRFIR